MGFAAAQVIVPFIVSTIDRFGNLAHDHKHPIELRLRITSTPRVVLGGITSAIANGGVALFDHAHLTLQPLAPRIGIVPVGNQAKRERHWLYAESFGVMHSPTLALHVKAGQPRALAFSTQPPVSVRVGTVVPRAVVWVEDGQQNHVTTTNFAISVAILRDVRGSAAGIDELNSSDPTSALEPVAVSPLLSSLTSNCTSQSFIIADLAFRSAGRYRLRATVPQEFVSWAESTVVHVLAGHPAALHLDSAASVAATAGSLFDSCVRFIVLDGFGNLVKDRPLKLPFCNRCPFATKHGAHVFFISHCALGRY